jgi:hypothetical protein
VLQVRISGSYDKPSQVDLEAMWEVYQKTFGGMREKIATKTVYTYDEFLNEVLDEAVYKLLVHNDENVVVAYLTLTRNLDKVSWIEPKFYEARYPELCAAGRLWFIMCIAALPRTDSIRPYSIILVSKVFEYLHDEMDMVCFDAFDHSVQKNSWPELIGKITSKILPIRVEEIYNHRYYSMERAPDKK